MKRTCILSLAFALKASAQWIVHDPGIAAQNQMNQLQNLYQYSQTAMNTAKTQLAAFQNYEQTLLQVARLGNPAALRALPGVSTVGEIVSMYGQMNYNYKQAQYMLNPQRYQYDMNSILATYQNPQWQGWATSAGSQVAPSQGLYQWATGSWNVANNAQQQFTALDQQREKLQLQRDQALRQMEAATTQSEVQKYSGVITALNGAIAEVSQAEQELTHRTSLQQSQLKAGQEIFQASQGEQQHAAALSQYDRDLMSFEALSGK